MIHILILISVLFLGIIIYLLNKIQADRLHYRSKIKILEDFIVHLNDEQKIQSNKILLSEDIQQKLSVINATLSKDIYELSFALFEDSHPRK
jgi:hypothetical protein